MKAKARSETAPDYIPNWSTLRDFLKSEAKIYLTINNNKAKISHNANKFEWTTVVKANQSVNATSGIQKGKSEITCFLCKQNHPAKRCPTFLSASIGQRVKSVNDLKLCMKCIHPIHPGKACKDEKCESNCPKCGESTFHNSLLCSKAYQAFAYSAERQAKNDDDWND